MSGRIRRNGSFDDLNKWRFANESAFISKTYMLKMQNYKKGRCSEGHMQQPETQTKAGIVSTEENGTIAA